MNRYCFFFFFALSLNSYCQEMFKPSEVEISNLPHWAQLMYGENPNVFEVDQAYQAYYTTHLFQKTYHTQYYKRWRRSAELYVQENGEVVFPSDQDKSQQRRAIIAKNQGVQRSGNWSLLGPHIAYNTNGAPVSQQSNVRSFDQSSSNSSILYCGTEPGEIYKSQDEGNSWTNVSLNDPLGGVVTAIEIHPLDPNIVLAGSGSFLYKTIDGGTTWTEVLSGLGSTHEITFVPSSPLIVFAATNDGFFRSVDGGDNWAQLYTSKSYDVKVNTGNDNIIYMVKHNSTENVCEFYRSSDMGSSFSIQTAGWHTSTDPGRNDGGARIAVTEADPDRVYAYLIGESKTGDTGYIGVYKSDDSGLNWSLPNGPAGGPYDANHVNLAIGTVSWQYHQGFYNCAIMASNTNADEILVGGLNLYKSDDGGTTFYPLSGYVGGPYNMHVDNQDFRNIGGTTWVTTDGGIYRSTDFFATDNYASKMNGIHGSDYWGFGQGWNEDVTVGGLYHNGNLASFDLWGPGQFLQLGGGEPASGYVNPGESRRVYSSDINGKIIPLIIGDPVENVGFGIDPNESYWSVESTELEFLPSCYSIAYTGKDHQLWRTEDYGVTFTPFAFFGSNPDDKITYIEIAWSDEDVMYVGQQMASGNLGKLWKTVDGGINWEQLTLPISAANRRMLIQVNPTDENEVYIAFASAGNNQKIYRSMDGGSSWTNLTTATLNNQSARSIILTGGTDGGVYYATNQTIYYKNNNMTDWEDFGDGLPVKTNTNIARPFYRDGKVRIASYGKGIWESPMFENQQKPIAKISVDKLSYTQHCTAEAFQYVDHSMLNHSGASWEWTFEGGTPSTSSAWSESVTYASSGTYLTTLKVTDAGGQFDIDSIYVVIDAYVPATVLNEDFENDFPADGFEINNPDEGQTWEQTTNAGGFGTSTNSMLLRGFDYWPGGDVDEIAVSIDMTNLLTPELSFDVAYARYAVNYSDTLEVLVSVDCGASYSSLFYKGGSDLATAPDLGSYFTPTASEWRTENIDLSAFEGINDVQIVFRSITGWGNNIYVDNINLDAVDFTDIREEQGNLSVYPNPLKSDGQLTLFSPNDEAIAIEIYTNDGKILYRSNHQSNSSFDMPAFASGAYIIILRSSKMIKKEILIVE